MTRERDVDGSDSAADAAHDLLDAALGAKVNVHLGRYDDATADAERAGAAVVVLLAAIAAARKRK